MPTNRDEAAARIKELTRKVEYHSRLYYQLDSPEISDYDYDMLFRELTELEQKYPELADPNSPTKRVGEKPPTASSRLYTPYRCKAFRMYSVTMRSKRSSSGLMTRRDRSARIRSSIKSTGFRSRCAMRTAYSSAARLAATDGSVKM